MTLFLVISALLAALTVVLLTHPLWRKARDDSASQSTGLALLRQQLEQLAGLQQSGALNDAQHAEARAALERKIAEAAAATPPVSAKPQRNMSLLLGVGSFVSAIAVASYVWLGTPQALDAAVVAGTASPTGEATPITAEQVEAMVETLAARLKDKPEDVTGWAMLGRAYSLLGRHDQAEPAFKRAVALRGDDATLLADYADALAMVNGQSLEGEPFGLIERALKLEPDNLKALSMAGTHAFVRKDYAGALRHWEKLAQLASSAEMAEQVQRGIDEARRLAAAPATAAPSATAATPAAANVAVSGTVTLDAALAAKARPEDTVFIFARAAEGSRMPLAILRKQVKDLPLSFTLDDSMAMTPAARLSSVPRVVVGARISASGQATAQAGDLQGFAAPVAPGATGMKIQINEVVTGP